MMSSEGAPGRDDQAAQESAESLKKEGFKRFMSKMKDVIFGRPEFEGLKKWFESRAAAMPEMKVTETALTGRGGWKAESTPEGTQVNKIVSGFFNLEGRDVDTGRKKPDGSPIAWNQAGIIQAESPIKLPTPEGEINMNVSGFVGIIRDTAGNVLLSVEQEPLAQGEKNAVVRTPFQTSATKLQGLLDGRKELDPGLAAALEAVGGGKTPYEMFESGLIKSFALPPADANRIQATNIGFLATVDDEAVREKLTAEGKNRWCTPEEVKALAEAGLINALTAAAILAVAFNPGNTEAKT